MRPQVSIHGHFYQPPRESPWTGLVERQPSAAPDHDWNLRIARECYLPNARLGNLERISFNFGPTLLAWADVACPELSRAVADADRAGGGNALAQLFSHPIAPLLSERDRRTQVRWGIADFVRRFGRRPEGMWLPECAVDLPSLRTLAEEGIAFTILSPLQADVAVGEEPESPARVDLGNGLSIAVFFYDRAASQAIAFDGALSSGEKLAEILKNAARSSFTFAATDGESYGHHARGGDRALADALALLSSDPEVELSTPAAVMRSAPPERAIAIRERTSWSCAHGIERWRSDCGCRQAGGQQRWRKGLREAVERLTERIHAIFEREGVAVLRDPWEARDKSEGLAPDALRRHAPFLECLRHPDRDDETRRALRLVEMERQCLFAHTSCAWFFDEISGIEPVQNLRFAARAIELSRAGAALEDEVLGRLRRAPSNVAEYGDGAAVYKRLVLPDAIDAAAAAGRAALRWTAAGADPSPATAGGRNVRAESFAREASGARRFLACTVVVEDPFDAPPARFAAAAVALGDGESFVYVAPARPAADEERRSAEALALFRTGKTPDLLTALPLLYPLRRLHVLDLGADEREAIAAASRPA